MEQSICCQKLWAFEQNLAFWFESVQKLMLNVKCMILHLRIKSYSIPVLFVHSSFREWAEEICRNHYVLSCSTRPKATKGARDNTTSKYGHVTRIHAQTVHLQLPFHQRIHQRCWRSVDSEHNKSLQAIRSY